MNEVRKPGNESGERHDVEITRDYDFRRESVFRMMTDTKTASRFYSPDGAEVDRFEWDPRPGGAVRIHGRYEGVVHDTTGTFVEFVAPERFVWRSATRIGDAVPFEALQTVRFEALGPSKTRVTVLVKILDAGSIPGGVPSLAEGFTGGWGQTLDNVERQLR